MEATAPSLLDPKLLRLFDALYTTRSVTRSAELLGVALDAMRALERFNPYLTGAVAREVVEHYGDAIGAHPVGTGAFRLGSWRRGSRIELLLGKLRETKSNLEFLLQVQKTTPVAVGSSDDDEL